MTDGASESKNFMLSVRFDDNDKEDIALLLASYIDKLGLGLSFVTSCDGITRKLISLISCWSWSFDFAVKLL